MLTLKHRGITEQVFASYTEFIDYAPNHGAYCRSFRETDMSKWYADKGPDDAIYLATHGWSKGRHAIRAICDDLNLIGRVRKPHVTYDVVGTGGWDMGRVVTGQPECAMEWEETEETGDYGNILKITVDVAPSSVIPEAMYRLRGAAILALIDSLESVGKRLEIEAIWYCERKRTQLTVPLKAAEQSAQDDQITFALAHPTFPRRFCHWVIGSSMPHKQHDYPADIYLPPMSAHDPHWADQASAVAWIEEWLAKFGIQLESEY